jgi:hypothetical protein
MKRKVETRPRQDPQINTTIRKNSISIVFGTAESFCKNVNCGVFFFFVSLDLNMREKSKEREVNKE